jgi:hypothetical protein
MAEQTFRVHQHNLETRRKTIIIQSLPQMAVDFLGLPDETTDDEAAQRYADYQAGVAAERAAEEARESAQAAASEIVSVFDPAAVEAMVATISDEAVREALSTLTETMKAMQVLLAKRSQV